MFPYSVLMSAFSLSFNPPIKQKIDIKVYKIAGNNVAAIKNSFIAHLIQLLGL